MCVLYNEITDCLTHKTHFLTGEWCARVVRGIFCIFVYFNPQLVTRLDPFPLPIVQPFSVKIWRNSSNLVKSTKFLHKVSLRYTF